MQVKHEIEQLIRYKTWFRRAFGSDSTLIYYDGKRFGKIERSGNKELPFSFEMSNAEFDIQEKGFTKKYDEVISLVYKKLFKSKKLRKANSGTLFRIKPEHVKIISPDYDHGTVLTFFSKDKKWLWGELQFGDCAAVHFLDANTLLVGYDPEKPDKALFVDKKEEQIISLFLDWEIPE